MQAKASLRTRKERTPKLGARSLEISQVAAPCEPGSALPLLLQVDRCLRHFVERRHRLGVRLISALLKD